MAEYLIQGDTLTEIAKAIRGKTGKTTNIKVSNMASEIASISGGSNIIYGTFSIENEEESTCMIDCPFMPDRLLMYGGNTNTNMGAFLISYDPDMYMYWNTGNTNIFAYDEKNNTIYRAYCDFHPTEPENSFFWLKRSGSKLIVSTGSSIYLSKGGWSFVAIE